MIIGAIKLKSTLWSYMSEIYLKRGLTSDATVEAHNAIAADAANQKGLTLFNHQVRFLYFQATCVWLGLCLRLATVRFRLRLAFL